MNFVILSRKTAKLGKGDLSVASLPTALGILGVSKRRRYFDHNRGYRTHKANVTTLYSMMEEARARHREGIKRHHPDRGGCHDTSARLNMAWSRVKELMKRRGICVLLPLALCFSGCAHSHLLASPDLNPRHAIATASAAQFIQAMSRAEVTPALVGQRQLPFLTNVTQTNFEIIFPDAYYLTNFTGFYEVAEELSGPWRYPFTPQMQDDGSVILHLDGARFIRWHGNPN